MPAFNLLTINKIRSQPDGVALSFSVPDELGPLYQFVPGQYLTLRAEIDGDDIRRSYSICSSRNSENLEVGIKRVEGGLFSNYAAELKVGDSLHVMTPEGRFTAEIGGTHNYLLIAAGSGITPCLSIAKSVLTEEPDSRITLLYGNRNTQSIMFREDIDNLKNQYTDRFMHTHILSAENQDASSLNGHINDEKLQHFNCTGVINLNSYDAIYLCGPQAMIENCTSSLVALGYNKKNIKFELFNTGKVDTAQKTASRTRKSTRSKASTGRHVTIILDGAEREITVSDETILNAAQNAGLDLPFSCAGGMCCTCRCKVASGKTAMDLNFSLADWEVEAGYTLACQTRPESDDVILDFDAT